MKIILAITIAIFGLPFVSSAETVTIPGTSISFDAPSEFKPLPKEIIDIKYPSSRSPRYVAGNESASTTIAYDLKPHNIPKDKLKEVQESFTSLFSRMIPGIQWKKNEIIRKDGTDWIYMEMTSNAIDTEIYNMMLVTGYENQMLVFNFNSTKKDFPKYEAQLRKSIESISLIPKKSAQDAAANP